MSWLLILVFGLVSFVPVAGLEAEDEKPPVSRRSGTGEMPGVWSMQLSVGHLPSADLHGIPGDVDITDYRLKVAGNVKLDERLTMTLGGGYGLKHLEAPSSAALPRNLQSLFIEAGARYRLNDRSFASIKLSPGLYSDFEDIGDDDLRMPVLALGGYSFANGFSAVGGFMYRLGYHGSRFIPVLGFSYQPDDSWRIDLIAPRPAITYLASRQLQLFVAGEFASDEYELRDRLLGAKVIRYSDYKAMFGINYLPVPAIKLSTSVGYAFERKFVFFDGDRSDLRMDNAPFLKLSLDVGW
jgi:hypothetical protein